MKVNVFRAVTKTRRFEMDQSFLWTFSVWHYEQKSHPKLTTSQHYGNAN
jgi:hypothetical protein